MSETTILLLFVTLLLGACLALVAMLLARRPPAAPVSDAEAARALAELGARHAQQLDASLAAGRQDLAAKKDLIDSRLQQVQADVRAELQRLGSLVGHLHQANAERFGQVDAALQQHTQAARVLADTAQGLHQALAGTAGRGQWGERMADDVLRLAGFVEGVNYVKQTPIGGGGVPDVTFHLPKGHVVHMDVKFPMSAYLRYLRASSDAERAAHLQAFLKDVRLRVKELAARDYARNDGRPGVDYVLLFLPNEQLTGFIFEHDPELIDHALAQRVVLCSPLTLFAFLGVIRQAFDAFMIEQTSDEILRLLGGFTTQWAKFTQSMDTLKRRFDTLAREVDQLTGPRRRQLERPLLQLEALRRERGLDPAGELFPGDDWSGDGGGDVPEDPDDIGALDRPSLPA